MVALKVKSGSCYDFFALEECGKCEVLDFLNDVQLSNPREFSKIIKDFDRTADIGLIRNPEKFKFLQDDIYEFKTFGGLRILCFIDGRSIVVLTNGFMKKKKYDSDIKHAVNLKIKYQDAKTNGYLTYKEEIL